MNAFTCNNFLPCLTNFSYELTTNCGANVVVCNYCRNLGLFNCRNAIVAFVGSAGVRVPIEDSTLFKNSGQVVCAHMPLSSINIIG